LTLLSSGREFYFASEAKRLNQSYREYFKNPRKNTFKNIIADGDKSKKNLNAGKK
jgi:hypothetical protein